MISMIKADEFNVISPPKNFILPNISDASLIRKSQEQLLYMLVTNTKNTTKYVTAFSVEVDNYSQLVIPACNLTLINAL